MYHSITFGDGTLDEKGKFIGVNTWDDWHLIPSSRPDISIPSLAANFVEYPGKNGAVDLTEILLNKPVYGDRSGSLEFYVDNDHEYWIDIYEKILRFLHGKRMKMVLEDEPYYYYDGRFSLNEWKSENYNSKVVINYVLAPYKYNIFGESGAWLWDPFNFETDRTDQYTGRRL